MSIKYVAIDVSAAMSAIRVESEKRRLLDERLIETQAGELIGYFHKLGRDTVVVFEEGCQSKWLHDLLRPYAGDVIVCDVSGNRRSGSKSDKLDTKLLLDWFRSGSFKRVYQGEPGQRGLKETARGYLAIQGDRARVKNRIKAVFRSWGIRCGDQKVYGKKHRSEWLEQLEGAARQRAERLYRQLDYLEPETRAAKKELMEQARKHPAYCLLRPIPGLGPVRVALILTWVMTPHRFRTKRQFWSYCGLAVKTWGSGEYEIVDGQIRHNPKRVLTRGLNRHRNAILKAVFKGAAEQAKRKQMRPRFEAARARGVTPSHATLNLARKLAAMTLAIWKSKQPYDETLAGTAA